MKAEALLSRLTKVKRIGAGRWKACCPAHQDKTPSLSIRETDAGVVLLHCFGEGCAAADIVAAVGMEVSDLFTDLPMRQDKPGKAIVSQVQAMEVLDEALIELLIIASDMAEKADPATRSRINRIIFVLNRLKDLTGRE